MSNVARRLGDEVVDEMGTVARCEGASVVVRVAIGEREARRAASCLLDPEPGDRVLLACSTRGERWILAVLDRDESRPARLTTEGDLALVSRKGRISLSAEAVGLAAKSVDVVATAIRACSRETELVTRTATLVSGVLHANAEVAKLVAGALECVADRLVQRAKSTLRLVEGADELRAGRIDHAARGAFRLHAQNAVVTADTLVKLDGDQIHLG